MDYTQFAGLNVRIITKDGVIYEGLVENSKVMEEFGFSIPFYIKSVSMPF